jgi:MFS family permease
VEAVLREPPTVALTVQMFGPERGGIIFGWIFAAHMLGAATVALAAGALPTWLGNYQLAFTSCGLLGVLAALLVLRICRPPQAPATHVVHLEQRFGG